MAVLDDLRFAGRGYLRRPLSSLAAVVLLGLGLGFNTALFAVVDAVLLTPLPYHQPDRIVMLWTGRNTDGTGGVSSYGDFIEWQTAAKSFSALAAYNITFGTVTGEGDPEEINGSVVSPDFFAVLGVRPLVGRTIAPGDELIAAAAGRPIVISHSLWKRRFGGDPAVIDRTLTLEDRPRRIVGVMPANFEHPEPFWGHAAEYWSPMLVSEAMRTAYGSRYLRVIGRLRDGVPIEAGRQEMDTIGRQLIERLPATHETSVVVAPMHDELAGGTARLALLFLAATVLVLILVSVNVANLLLARINHRRLEFAVRTALGAGRGRLISQVLAESLLLGVAGGVAGLLCAKLGIQLVLAYGPGQLPGLEQAALDLRAMGFAIALAACTGLLCGAVPALRLARARLSGLLGSARASTGLEVSRRRTLIVATEVALAVPLLAGAALLVRTLIALQLVHPGFDPSNAMQFRLSLPQTRYADREARVAFFADMTERLAALPGVTAAGAASSLPLGGLNNTGGSIVFARADGSLAETGVGTRAITSGYFAAMGVPLQQGRLLTDGPEDASAVVINARAAESLWPGLSPLGRRIRAGQLADPPDDAPWLTVVGVVGDMRHEALGRQANAEIFQSHRSNVWSTMSIVVRSDGDPGALSTAIRDIVRARDPRLPIVGLGPVSAFLDGQLARPRFGALCAALFGVLGLTLTGAGTFAVLSLVVGQRVREIGIRMAFGASPRTVGTQVMVHSMAPALAGAGLGLLATTWLTRALDSVLYQVAPRDPVLLAGSAVVVLTVALLAAALPTWRAMRTDPIAALRAE